MVGGAGSVAACLDRVPGAGTAGVRASTRRVAGCTKCASLAPHCSRGYHKGTRAHRNRAQHHLPAAFEARSQRHRYSIAAALMRKQGGRYRLNNLSVQSPAAAQHSRPIGKTGRQIDHAFVAPFEISAASCLPHEIRAASSARLVIMATWTYLIPT